MPSVSLSISTYDRLNSTENDTLNCLYDQNFATANDMLYCYRYFYRQRWVISTAEILLALSIVTFNTLVVILLAKKPRALGKLSIFDKIMIAHCVVDGFTGLLDVPFFHFNHVLGYWPFGTVTSLVWTSFDNAINVITNMHMLYMTWIRFRSIVALNTYEKEFLARYPLAVSLSLWAMGFLIWTPITFSYGVVQFTTNIDFEPSYIQVVLIFITWFSPLLAIIVLAAIILVILNKRNRRVAHMKRFTPSMITHTAAFSGHSDAGDGGHAGGAAYTESSHTKRKSQFMRKIKKHMHLGPQSRFEIIILSYWLQWFPSCLIAIIDPLCACVPSSLSSTIYWLTYTVCLTDPLVILIFNPNVAIIRRRSNLP